MHAFRLLRRTLDDLSQKVEEPALASYFVQVTEKVERSPAVAIANAIVQIHKENYGKGATRARTRLMEDTIVVELDDVLTRVEHTLVAAGHADQVRDTRQIFQDMHRPAFIGAVEDITGRTVRAFMSQVHFDPDIAVEIFLLEPEEDDE